jgi:hypothetical protein
MRQQKEEAERRKREEPDSPDIPDPVEEPVEEVEEDVGGLPIDSDPNGYPDSKEKYDLIVRRANKGKGIFTDSKFDATDE